MCVDYSAVWRTLVAYRWTGQTELTAANLVRIDDDGLTRCCRPSRRNCWCGPPWNAVPTCSSALFNDVPRVQRYAAAIAGVRFSAATQCTNTCSPDSTDRRSSRRCREGRTRFGLPSRTGVDQPDGALFHVGRDVVGPHPAQRDHHGRAVRRRRRRRRPMPNPAPSSTVELLGPSAATYSGTSCSMPGQPSGSGWPPFTARRAIESRSRPMIAARRRCAVHGASAATPAGSPSRPTGRRAATRRSRRRVVSPPALAAARSASARWSHATVRSASAVDVIAAIASWNARTTQPLFVCSSAGSRPIASSMRVRPISSVVARSRPATSAARQSNPPPAPAVVIAHSIASDHSTQASTLSGWGWVSDATRGGEAGDGSAVAHVGEHDRSRAHQAPLPAESGCSAWYACADSAADSCRRPTALSTAAVWLPTSHGRLRYQRTISSPMDRDVCRALEHREDGQCHLRVVRPLARLPAEVAAALISHGAAGFGGWNSYGTPSTSPTAEAITAPTARSVVAASIDDIIAADRHLAGRTWSRAMRMAGSVRERMSSGRKMFWR